MSDTKWENLVLGDALTALAADQAEWSRATFGADDVRGPTGPMEHLRKEAKECLTALKKFGKHAAKPGSSKAWADAMVGRRNSVESEFADILILLLDSSRRFGLSPADLVRLGGEKMAENRKRSWPSLGEQCPDKPVEHTKPRKRKGKK